MVDLSSAGRDDEWYCVFVTSETDRKPPVIVVDVPGHDGDSLAFEAAPSCIHLEEPEAGVSWVIMGDPFEVNLTVLTTDRTVPTYP